MLYFLKNIIYHCKHEKSLLGKKRFDFSERYELHPISFEAKEVEKFHSTFLHILKENNHFLFDF